MKNAFAALILAGVTAIGANTYAIEPEERERAMQRRLDAIVTDSSSENERRQPRARKAEQMLPPGALQYVPEKEAAKLELAQELDPEEKVKLGIGMRADRHSKPEELRVGIESRHGKIAYISDFKNKRERIAAEVNAGKGKLGVNILDYKHAQVSASIPLGKELRVSAGHDSLAKTNTARLDYTRKTASMAVSNIAYPDGTQARSATLTLKMPANVKAALSHSHKAYANAPVNSTSITLEKSIKEGPISRAYVNYSYAERQGESYRGSKFGIEKKLDWLQVHTWAEKPAGMDKYFYGATGNIKLSW